MKLAFVIAVGWYATLHLGLVIWLLIVAGDDVPKKMTVLELCTQTFFFPFLISLIIFSVHAYRSLSVDDSEEEESETYASNA